MFFDIFNGDADGICALHQLRLADPRPDAILLTGVKRDVRLLSRPELAPIRGCVLTVLDISLDSNAAELQHLLDRENRIHYVDHHAASMVPDSDLLTTNIELSGETCTSLIVNSTLNDRFGAWAVCGAYGDNLHKSAHNLAHHLKLTQAKESHLQEMGELLNYNGYGASIDDLHFHPAELYRSLHSYQDPIDFFHNAEELTTLRAGYNEDLELAMTCKEMKNSGRNRIFHLPDTEWARRISGVFANLKARERMDAAHALITDNGDSTVSISVRAPLNDKRDAARLCKLFPSGGGRAAAAGINSMPESMLDTFIREFNNTYRS